MRPRWMRIPQWDEILLGIVLGLLMVLVPSTMAFQFGRSTRCTADLSAMWENPPGMASCRVYPDGSKRCIPAHVIEPRSKVEQGRILRGQQRMSKIRAST